MISNEKGNKELELLLLFYQHKYGMLASPVADLILKYLGEGTPASRAIYKAFKETNFLAKLDALILDTAVQGAELGYGLKAEKSVSTKLLTKQWSPDGVNLSDRLHSAHTRIQDTIKSTVEQQVKAGASVKELSRELYDGYASKSAVVQQAELPKYMQQLVSKANKLALDGDSGSRKSLNKAIKSVEKQVAKLAGKGAPTKALKSAYEQLVTACDTASTEAIQKAVTTALEEKSRYIADRIARTETARAWGDGFFANNLPDEDVIAFKWQLSSRHPQYDICDIHANTNSYGLGKGIYPKNKFPRYTAHPHCTCQMSVVYRGNLKLNNLDEQHMLDTAVFSEQAIRDYIQAQPRKHQLSLLGEKGVDALSKGGDWMLGYIRSWQYHANPASRLTASDFK